jgi:predicted AAA+ superfamily ATPase
MNRGEEHAIYFWRDSTGNEIDVLIDEGENLTPLEIKAGQTVATDFLKGIRFWKKLSSDIEKRAALVYGGDKSYIRSDTYVCAWSVF